MSSKSQSDYNITHQLKHASLKRINKLFAKLRPDLNKDNLLLQSNASAAYTALIKCRDLVDWLAKRSAPTEHGERAGSGIHHWKCGLCGQSVATYLTLDLHVCKHIKVPAELVPLTDGNKCWLCKQNTKPEEEHKCASLFIRVALVDFGGRVCNEGLLSRLTAVAEKGAEDVHGLAEACGKLRRLNARVVAVVDVPGEGAANPSTTVAWIAQSQMPVQPPMQGLYVLRGRQLVYWGPRARARTGEELVGEGAASFSDMEWIRSLCNPPVPSGTQVVGTFGGLIARGFPFGGAATMINHQCKPTADVEHTFEQLPLENDSKKKKAVPVVLLRLREEFVGRMVEVTYQYYGQTDVQSEEIRCMCTPGCKKWVVEFKPGNKKPRVL